MDLPLKPRAGIYIDDSNLYKRGRASGWMVDYNKLYQWVSKINIIVHARVYIGLPKYEPGRSIVLRMIRHLEKTGYVPTTKDLKRLRDEGSSEGFKNKCNFDIEMHDEIMRDLSEIDVVYIASGDSDFIRTKDNILKCGKRVKFLAYSKNCAWEIRSGSWYVSLDSIKAEVSHITEKPGTRPGEVAQG